jgi:hypothetical protein
MTTFDNEIKQKLCFKFYCEICDYGTCKKSSFNNHNESKKHKNNEMTTNNNENYAQNSKKKIQCPNCTKSYNDRAGLWRHKKKCTGVNNDDEQTTNNNINPDLIIEIIKQNQELQKQNYDLQKQIIEVCKNNANTINSNNTNTNNNNSHNKSFNLQFFLNETCKDAMNIMDFVESIQLQLTDLEKVGKLGYIEGISNIIVKNLNSLDESKRPVHCTDSKREVMYVKDQDKWEKENEQKIKLRKVIKQVTHKNSKLLKDYVNLYPDCWKSDSKLSDYYNKLVIEAMGGKGDNYFDKEDKIIHNIAKEVIIEK